jgi:hypothetical protein
MFQQLSTTWLVQEQSLAGSSSAVPFRLDRRPTCKLMKLNMRDAFCSSGNRLQSCWPLTWIVPVLGAGTGLGATTKATVPLPVPEDPEVIEIQGAALSADHTQLVADAIEIDPAPPVPGVSEAFDRSYYF